jgi:DNA topoisomerase II
VQLLLPLLLSRRPRVVLQVAQLAGYVAEHSAYHHGEASLQATIVNLAQDYVSSNNINLLFPSGQFGTRLQGGKDSASARYIFTRLALLTRHLFNEDDDALLEYQTEEGQKIEPTWCAPLPGRDVRIQQIDSSGSIEMPALHFSRSVCISHHCKAPLNGTDPAAARRYLPILPLVLINGAEGIGTGWSTSIPNYNPLDIAVNVRRMLAGDDPEEMAPWYRGFTGEIKEVPPAKNATGKSYAVSGTIEQARRR